MRNIDAARSKRSTSVKRGPARALLLLALIAMILSASLVLLREPSTTTETSTPVTPGEEWGSVSSEGSGYPSGIVADLPAVPIRTISTPYLDWSDFTAIDTPVQARVDELLVRMEGGDAVAGCLVMMSSLICREEQRHLNVHNGLQRSAVLKQPVVGDGMYAGKSSAYCGGLELERLPSADEVFAEFKGKLSTDQKVALALLQSDGSIRRLSDRNAHVASSSYVIPQFQANHALEYLLEGYSAGSRLAMEGLVQVYSPAISLNNINPSLRLPDPRRFVFYSMVLARLYGQEALGARGMKAYQVVVAQMSLDELEALGRLAIREEKRLREAPRNSQREATLASALELCAP